MAMRTNAGKSLYTDNHRGNFSFDEDNQVNVVLPVEYSPEGSLKRKVTGNMALRIDDTSTANVTYVGKAPVGSATSDSVWQIKKIDTSSGTSITWADGDDEFNNEWDNVTSLSYS